MRPRSLFLPTLVGAGLLGLWAGTGFGAVPQPPTLSLPTVTVALPPTPPTPLPPPPTVTVAPPKVEPPPLPAPPTPTASVPAVPAPTPVSPAPPPPADPAPSDPVSAGAASSRLFTLRERRAARTRAAATALTQVRRTAEKTPAHVATPATHGRIREERSPGLAFGTLQAASGAIPSALFAMAALAVLLLGLASFPRPAVGSRTGAMLVHNRGSIAAAGLAALAMAVATYLLL